MRLRLLSSIALLVATPAFANPHIHRGPTSPRVAHTTTSRPHIGGIEPERATQIQTALTKAGYMSGTASGEWDAPTEAAMEKFQADNGWQTKLVPDARAIIKLGLGPGSHPPAAATAEPHNDAPPVTQAN